MTAIVKIFTWAYVKEGLILLLFGVAFYTILILY